MTIDNYVCLQWNLCTYIFICEASRTDQVDERKNCKATHKAACATSSVAIASTFLHFSVRLSRACFNYYELYAYSEDSMSLPHFRCVCMINSNQRNATRFQT